MPLTVCCKTSATLTLASSSTCAPAARRLAARMAAPRRPLPLPLEEALPAPPLLPPLAPLSLRPVSVCRRPVDITCGHPGKACGVDTLLTGWVWTPAQSHAAAWLIITADPGSLVHVNVIFS